ncbi:fimbria/pilus periplasmic chaperone [Cupriavidus sp. WKF15]|uniref:fimbria/pilus periplasmic chaperone n=1 Tax=Cupriavidus sp. WKF15 TaxID=3032282 RepID=UPI0023E19588|nr:fimbria/pilus periplasmic chaperone [Cupriavidus sp. WKF15]WER47478.1 fimbria/pilus periplasmic chaperone [Cupriavidus sp. WKF15]
MPSYILFRSRLLAAILLAVLLSLGLADATVAQASVVIAGTRVIYNARDREVTVKLTNEGPMPALVQSWLDNGDSTAAPTGISVPFMLTPPIARIDAGKGQSLRIVYTGEPLPEDRESVFWLNVLEIPPKPSAEEAGPNKLQLAFRSRIKFFYRPAGLKGEAGEAPAKLAWRLSRGEGQSVLVAHNPTPFHVSVVSVELTGGGKRAVSDLGGMVAPGESLRFTLQGNVPASADSKVRYHTLNDWGGSTDGDAALAGID